MKIVKFLSVASLMVLMSSCNKQGVTNKPLNTEIDSVSYAIGMDVAKNVRATFVDDFDSELFIQGYMNTIDSSEVLIEKENATALVRAYLAKNQERQRVKQREDAIKKAEEQFNDVKIASENFLEGNKSKDGVKTTETGLQYIVLKEGSGEKPLATSKVVVHYHGTLIDGTVFDSSVDRGTPYTTFANQVIRGWTEALELMPVGSKYKLFVPQDLAYGAFPHQGGKVRPFDALIFEVELLEIVQ